ncbi:MAG: DMT family transporter [Synergistales bacterium]|jgi:drug/metabolite transporter (DMT)-like permease
MRKSILADGTMLLVAFLWGAGYPASDFLLQEMGPLWLSAIRLGIAALVMSFLFRERIARVERRLLLPAAGAGLVIAALFLLQIFGLLHTTPGRQAFIAGTNVVMVPLLYSLLYRRRPAASGFAAALLCSAGLMVMAFTPGMAFNRGDVLSCLLALSIALDIIVIGHLCRVMDPMALAVFQVDTAALFVGVAAILFEPFPEVSLSLPGWTALAYLVFGLTLFAFWAQNTAQKFCDDTHAGILLSLEGPFGYILSVAAGREPLNGQVFLGGSIILAGVFLSVWSEAGRRKRKK